MNILHKFESKMQTLKNLKREKIVRKCATLNIATELKRYCDWIGTVGLVVHV